jgi:uncharacterized protein
VRTDIEFQSDGATCRGWFYRPDNATEDRPIMVMCTGLGWVKEFILGPYSEMFVQAGYCTLAFDYRHSGASDGMPRGHVIPRLQHEDIRAAVTFAAKQEGVDADKIILWGCSYGGAHSLFVGALDPRVKGVIALVPGLGPRAMIEQSRDLWDQFLAQTTDEMIERNETGVHGTIPIVAPRGEHCLFPHKECYPWIMANATRAPNWINQVTLESVFRSMEYTPAAFIDLISPKPLLMMVTEGDTMVSQELTQEMFDRANDPKELHTFPGHHFGIYPSPSDVNSSEEAMKIMVAWLERYFG